MFQIVSGGGAYSAEFTVSDPDQGQIEVGRPYPTGHRMSGWYVVGGTPTPALLAAASKEVERRTGYAAEVFTDY